MKPETTIRIIDTLIFIFKWLIALLFVAFTFLLIFGVAIYQDASTYMKVLYSPTQTEAEAWQIFLQNTGLNNPFGAGKLSYTILFVAALFLLKPALTKLQRMLDGE